MPKARARLDADDEHDDGPDNRQDDLRLDDGGHPRRRALPSRPEGERGAQERGQRQAHEGFADFLHSRYGFADLLQGWHAASL